MLHCIIHTCILVHTYYNNYVSSFGLTPTRSIPRDLGDVHATQTCTRTRYTGEERIEMADDDEYNGDKDNEEIREDNTKGDSSTYEDSH